MVATLVVAAGLVEAAPYLQNGVDAARTGLAPDPGPATDDVACSLRLPGFRAPLTHPAVLRDRILVLTSDLREFYPEPEYEGLGTNAIWEIDAATCTPTILAHIPQASFGWVLDETQALVASGGLITSWSLDGGVAGWSWVPPSVGFSARQLECPSMARQGTALFLSCIAADAPPNSTMLRNAFIFASSIDARDGDESWTWFKDPLFNVLRTLRPEGRPAVIDSGTNGVTVVGSHVVVQTAEFVGTAGIGQSQLNVLGVENGSLAWSTNSSQSALPVQNQFGKPPHFTTYAPALPTGTERSLYIKLNDVLKALNTPTGKERWSHDLGTHDGRSEGFGSGLALDGTSLFVSSYETIRRLDLVSREAAWEFALPSPSEMWSSQIPLVGGDHLYARSIVADGRDVSANLSRLYAIHVADGTLAWVHDLPTLPARLVFGPQTSLALGEGLLVAATHDGQVKVFGRTEGSIGVELEPQEDPQEGEAWVVRLDRTLPGSQGPATRFSATWGDGSSTPWTGAPVLAHTYARPGNYTATFHAANEAGQSSRETVLVRVGAAEALEATARPGEVTSGPGPGEPRTAEPWRSIAAIVGKALGEEYRAEREIIAVLGLPGFTFLAAVYVRNRISEHLGAGYMNDLHKVLHSRLEPREKRRKLGETMAAARRTRWLLRRGDYSELRREAFKDLSALLVTEFRLPAEAGEGMKHAIDKAGTKPYPAAEAAVRGARLPPAVERRVLAALDPWRDY